MRRPLMLVAVVLSACASLQDGTPAAGPTTGSTSRTATTTAEPVLREDFVPPTSREGDTEVLPLTFPDGSSVVLRYPAVLALADMGAQPDVDFVWNGRWIGAFVFSYGGPYDDVLAGDSPRAWHGDEGVRVEEWEAAPGLTGRAQDTERWLIYRLSTWTVHVPLNDRSPVGHVLDALTITERSDGFVVVDAEHPAELPEGFGEAGGPQLAFGDGDPSADLFRGVRLVHVAPSACGGEARDIALNGTYGSACILGRSVFVDAQLFEPQNHESEDFLRTLIREVQASDLRRPR